MVLLLIIRLAPLEAGYPIFVPENLDTVFESKNKEGTTDYPPSLLVRLASISPILSTYRSRVVSKPDWPMSNVRVVVKYAILLTVSF